MNNPNNNKKKLSEIILSGSFGDFSERTTVAETESLLGVPVGRTDKKKQSVLMYEGAEMVFVFGRLRQLTVVIENRTSALLSRFGVEIDGSTPEFFDHLVQKHGFKMELKDQVIPFFSCYRVYSDSTNEIYVNFSPADGNSLISFALIFAQPEKTHEVTVKLKGELYNRLCRQADTERIPVAELCHRWIEEGIGRM